MIFELDCILGEKNFVSIGQNQWFILPLNDQTGYIYNKKELISIEYDESLNRIYEVELNVVENGQKEGKTEEKIVEIEKIEIVENCRGGNN